MGLTGRHPRRRPPRAHGAHSTWAPGIIGDDEPVFLIRGNDVAAPGAIEAWADIAVAHGASPALSRVARRWAQRVRAWQAEHGGRLPVVEEPDC